jgi:mRNA interferase RelE/StbE
MLAVSYQKKFLKDLANIPPNFRHEIEHFVFDVLPVTKTLADSNKFEKMSGYENYVKARFGDYRIGAYYSKNNLELRRVLHRKEIYRYFP